MKLAQQLGRYQLLDRIAYGGMAEIYRAKTFDGDGQVHLVAVKKVLQHLTNDDDFLRMLVDEAKISAVLKHDNIARVYEFAHDRDEYFLAMEFVDGKDVRTLLEKHRNAKQPIPPEHVAWVGMQIGQALAAAHTQRDGAGRAMHIVHRDVSPSNILCSYRGEVKLCDFGIAKATLTRVQTKTGVIKGKVKYMSPEQAMGRRLDHRSDLFSLGTVLYEMLTLQPPFVAQSEVEMIFAVRDARTKDMRDLNKDVPPDLVTAVNKLMSRSRSQRYQSGQDLALSMRMYLDKYKPGYRRSHFGRYMRKLFDSDIDRELRLMEEYVIDQADPTKVGVNLIAEALGNDAPYTQFTAAMMGTRAGSNVQTAMFPRVEPPDPTDLHSEPTQILRRNIPSSLHELKTQMFDLKARPIDHPNESSELPVQANLHELSTQIFQLPDEGPRSASGAIETSDQRGKLRKDDSLPNSTEIPTPAIAMPLRRPTLARGEISRVDSNSAQNGIDSQAGTQIVGQLDSISVDPSLALESSVDSGAPGARPIPSLTAPIKRESPSQIADTAAQLKAQTSTSDPLELPELRTAIGPPPSSIVKNRSTTNLPYIDPDEPPPLPPLPSTGSSPLVGGDLSPFEQPHQVSPPKEAEPAPRPVRRTKIAHPPPFDTQRTGAIPDEPAAPRTFRESKEGREEGEETPVALSDEDLEDLD